ncbi:MAG: hypothetical protein R3E50_12150 [Halioglobus sp.]
MQADITTLQWGESDLAGSVTYHRTTPPSVAIDLHGGTLSLLPWENAYLKDARKTTQEDPATTLRSAARASADWVGHLLLTPLRLLSDEDDAAPGKKLFSSEPLPLDDLKAVNLTLSGELGSLLSTAVTANNLKFNGTLRDGQLALTGSSGDMNGGDGQIELSVDADTAPPVFKLRSTFKNVRGLTGRDTYPRSGFVSVDSRGQSEAEIAANVAGLVYLELGAGPFDYANSTLLTANIATTVFQTLIPGIDRTQSQLECGITLGLLQDGKGLTPYGFAARTNQANLLGHLKVDLRKETMEMSLDSRGRQGVGISVGSIFSNTIQIKGPLTNPGIVPDATGLAWRGWAAFMTGGLSVLGESLIKRVLASENPCTSIRELITRDLCPKNTLAASSPMVCPQAP